MKVDLVLEALSDNKKVQPSLIIKLQLKQFEEKYGKFDQDDFKTLQKIFQTKITINAVFSGLNTFTFLQKTQNDIDPRTYFKDYLQVNTILNKYKLLQNLDDQDRFKLNQKGKDLFYIIGLNLINQGMVKK